jgi:hypothetical protein
MKTTNEMANIIYDTLMGNTQHEVLELADIVNPCISKNEIVFDYRGKHIFMRILEDNI